MRITRTLRQHATGSPGLRGEPASGSQGGPEVIRHYKKVDVTELQRREFDPATLARLDALGLAT